MSTETKPEEQLLNIKCLGQGGRELKFKVKNTTRFHRVFEAYASEEKMPIQSLRFLFDGSRVAPEKCPNDLEMEDGDVIDVYVEQTGGGASQLFADLAGLGGPAARTDMAAAPPAPPQLVPLPTIAHIEKATTSDAHVENHEQQLGTPDEEIPRSLLQRTLLRALREEADKHVIAEKAAAGQRFDKIAEIFSSVPIVPFSDKPSLGPFTFALELAFRAVGLCDRHGYVIAKPKKAGVVHDLYLARINPLILFLRSRRSAEEVDYAIVAIGALVDEGLKARIKREYPNEWCDVQAERAVSLLINNPDRSDILIEAVHEFADAQQREQEEATADWERDRSASAI
jgi:small ubiquitin-related modifier